MQTTAQPNSISADAQERPLPAPECLDAGSAVRRVTLGFRAIASTSADAENGELTLTEVAPERDGDQAYADL